MPGEDHQPRWRFLPRLTCSGSEICLPFPQATEMAWLHGSLTADPQPLAQALLFDPTSTLWALLSAGEANPIATLHHCATWLIAEGLNPLLWREPESLSSLSLPSAFPKPHRWRALAVEGVSLAWSTRVGQAPSPEHGPAFLRALVQNAEAWLATCAAKPCPGEPPCERLPTWMKKVLSEPAGRRPENQGAANAAWSATQQHAVETATRWQTSQLQGSLVLPAWVRQRGATPAPVPAVAKNSAPTYEPTPLDDPAENARLAALAEFAAGAGHEINNPIAVISGRAQLLISGETNPERRRDLATIHAQAVRVHEMIADLMYFARPPQPKPASFSLTEAVDGLLAELARQGSYPHVVFRRGGDSGPVTVTADRAQLLAAIRALCLNSLFALQGAGVLEIELSQPLVEQSAQPTAGETRIAVRDTGPGISPEVRKHLFEPYFSGRESGRGLGVGLSKVWRIIEQHGGRIELASVPGEGTTITLILPPAGPLRGVGVQAT